VHGSGLGLSLVDRIVRQHGGRVQVHSNPKGTTFTMLIPAAPEATAPAVVESEMAPVDARLAGRGHAS
jgi:nitrogen-specific signal transduction histidine kinase